jgi:molybdopterin-containing oxidoreductase family membrane subunit
MAFNIVALLLLMIHKTRTNMFTLTIACVLGFVGIWIERVIGMVVPGFIPTPLGEVFEYAPTMREIGVSVGIYALGALVFTILAKGGIAIELGMVGAKKPSEAVRKARDGDLGGQATSSPN